MGVSFYVTLGLYMVILIIIGVFFSKRSKSFDDYFLAGRNLGIWQTTATNLASWAGAGVVIGFTGYFFEGGYSMIWIAIPTAIGVYAFAFLLSRRISNIRQYTIPDLLELRYSKTAKYVGGVFILIYMIGLTAANFMAAGWILNVVTGLRFEIGMIIAAVVIVAYTMLGGLKAVAWTDIFQWIILSIGIILAIIFVLMRVGGWSEMHATIAASEETSWMLYPMAVFDIKTIISFFFIFTLPFIIDPIMYQRCYAARTPRIARLAVTYTGIFDGFLTFGAIVIAFGAVILFGSVEGFAPDSSFPMIVKEIIPGYAGVFILVALIAAVMSSADTTLLVSGGTVSQDYYKPIAKNPNDRTAKRITLIAVPIIAILALFLAWQFEYIMEVCIFAFSVFVAGAVVPIIGAFYFKRGTNAGAIASMIGGGGIAIVWKILGEPFGYDPVMPGLALSIILYFVISYCTRRPDPSKIEPFLKSAEEVSKDTGTAVN